LEFVDGFFKAIAAAEAPQEFEGGAHGIKGGDF
jgi:hypothetical protein